jgi:type I restriction-modification system DNA methylase subunit
LEDRDEYLSEGVFWVPEGHRWDDLRKAAKQADIGTRIDEAMDAIEKDNPSLKGVLPKSYVNRPGFGRHFPRWEGWQYVTEVQSGVQSQGGSFGS